MQFTCLQGVGHGPVSAVLFLHTRCLFRPVRPFWTAFWSNGPNWPAGGEIDIIEGVNDYTNNQATIHTSDGCSLPTSSSSQLNIAGTVVGGTNCAADQTGNQGCGVRSSSNTTFGSGFNSIGGGVYASKVFPLGM